MQANQITMRSPDWQHIKQFLKAHEKHESFTFSEAVAFLEKRHGLKYQQIWYYMRVCTMLGIIERVRHGVYQVNKEQLRRHLGD